MLPLNQHKHRDVVSAHVAIQAAARQQTTPRVRRVRPAVHSFVLAVPGGLVLLGCLQERRLVSTQPILPPEIARVHVTARVALNSLCCRHPARAQSAGLERGANWCRDAADQIVEFRPGGIARKSRCGVGDHPGDRAARQARPKDGVAGCAGDYVSYQCVCCSALGTTFKASLQPGLRAVCYQVF